MKSRALQLGHRLGELPVSGERAKVVEQGRQEDAFQLTGHQTDVPTHGR